MFKLMSNRLSLSPVHPRYLILFNSPQEASALALNHSYAICVQSLHMDIPQCCLWHHQQLFLCAVCSCSQVLIGRRRLWCLPRALGNEFLSSFVTVSSVLCYRFVQMSGVDWRTSRQHCGCRIQSHNGDDFSWTSHFWGCRCFQFQSGIWTGVQKCAKQFCKISQRSTVKWRVYRFISRPTFNKIYTHVYTEY